MAAGPRLTFAGVTTQQFSTLTAKAQAAGIGLSGNSGSATKFGVEVAWNYAPETQELTLQCMSTPFFMSAEDVSTRIRALVQESLG